MTKKAKASKPRKSHWIKIGVFATATYFIVIAVIAWQKETSLLDRLSNLKLNELGDMLAGAFAPLAFLWLLIATIIQGQELHDSRVVMKEQADASKKQAKAADTQVNYMGEQASAIREQNRISAEVAAANYQLALHEKRLDLYAALDDIGLKVLQNNGIDDETRNLLHRAIYRGRWIVGPEERQWLDELSHLVREVWKMNFKRMRLQAGLATAEQRGLDLSQIQTELEKVHEEVTENTSLIDDLLEPASLNKIFGKYLELPDSVGSTLREASDNVDITQFEVEMSESGDFRQNF